MSCDHAAHALMDLSSLILFLLIALAAHLALHAQADVSNNVIRN